jgi:hypothetical protein
VPLARGGSPTALYLWGPTAYQPYEWRSPHAGRPEDALNAAEQALQLLAQQAGQGDTSCYPQLAKAYHRKAQAWVGLGSIITAIRVYRQGLAACRGCEEELLAALRITTDLLPPSWLAKVGRGALGQGGSWQGGQPQERLRPAGHWFSMLACWNSLALAGLL